MKTQKSKVMSNYNPLVSIIIPVYNGELFIREAINSCLNQTYDNIEIVIVNDGSTDQTDKIVQREYINKVRYFKKKNGGVASALNLAIKQAKGKYISWLSHDDVYLPNKITDQIDFLNNISEAARDSTILYTNYSVINSKGNLISETSNIQRYHIKKLEDPYFPLLHGLIHGCTLLIPRRCFDDKFQFNEELRYTQDYDLWFSMFPKYKINFLESISVLSRSHEGQGTKNVTPKAEKEYDELWIKMLSSISPEQMKFMEGSERKFYNKMLEIAYDAKYLGAVLFIEDKISELKNRRFEKWKRRVLKILKAPLLIDPRYRQIVKVQRQQRQLSIKIDYLLTKLRDFNKLIEEANAKQSQSLEGIKSGLKPR